MILAVSRAVVLTVLVAACAPTDRASTDSTVAASAAPRDTMTSEWSVSPRGIGFVKTGMSMAILNEALNEDVAPPAPADSGCAYITPTELPAGVSLMVSRDAVVRVDVDVAGILTEDGVGIGDPESTVMRVYAGRIRSEPHKYTGPVGHNLIVSNPTDSDHLIVFETDGEKVMRFRAGQRAAAELVERCG